MSNIQVKPRRIRFTLRLRTLMLIVLAIAAWLGVQAEKVRRQRLAIATIQQFNGTFHYDYQFANDKLVTGRDPGEPKWLIRFAGVDWFHDVVEVDFANPYSSGGLFWTDGDIEAVVSIISDLPRIRVLVARERHVFRESS